MTQERIRQERREAARSARQEERLRQLERAVGEQSNVPEKGDSTPGSSGVGVADTEESWPAGTSAWTVVLASAQTRDQADQVAERARSAGLEQVGILQSDNHSSLHRGYWVAYTGVLDQAAAAQRQAEARTAGFGDAYARWVSGR